MKKDADPAPSKTIKLNIGGSSAPSKAQEEKSAPASTAPASSTALAAAKSSAPSVPTSAPSTAPATGTNTPSIVSKAKDFNFTSDKAKTTADAVLKDTLAVADQETLKDLYGDGDMVDSNGTSSS